jgi:hypothetical protein
VGHLELLLQQSFRIIALTHVFFQFAAKVPAWIADIFASFAI